MARLLSAHPSPETLKVIESAFTEAGKENHFSVKSIATSHQRVSGISTDLTVVDVTFRTNGQRNRARQWVAEEGFDVLRSLSFEAARPLRVLGTKGANEHPPILVPGSK